MKLTEFLAEELSESNGITVNDSILLESEEKDFINDLDLTIDELINDAKSSNSSILISSIVDALATELKTMPKQLRAMMVKFKSKYTGNNPVFAIIKGKEMKRTNFMSLKGSTLKKLSKNKGLQKEYQK